MPTSRFSAITVRPFGAWISSGVNGARARPIPSAVPIRSACAPVGVLFGPQAQLGERVVTRQSSAVGALSGSRVHRRRDDRRVTGGQRHATPRLAARAGGEQRTDQRDACEREKRGGEDEHDQPREAAGDYRRPTRSSCEACRAPARLRSGFERQLVRASTDRHRPPHDNLPAAHDDPADDHRFARHELPQLRLRGALRPDRRGRAATRTSGGSRGTRSRADRLVHIALGHEHDALPPRVLPVKRILARVGAAGPQQRSRRAARTRARERGRGTRTRPAAGVQPAP